MTFIAQLALALTVQAQFDSAQGTTNQTEDLIMFTDLPSARMVLAIEDAQLALHLCSEGHVTEAYRYQLERVQKAQATVDRLVSR